MAMPGEKVSIGKCGQQRLGSANASIHPMLYTLDTYATPG